MKYYFCGIGGIGMSSIAQYLRLKGHDVAGSDRAFDLGNNDSMRRKLEALGARIFPQNGTGVTADTDVFVVSTAVEPQIPDVKRAQELGLKIQNGQKFWPTFYMPIPALPWPEPAEKQLLRLWRGIF